MSLEHEHQSQRLGISRFDEQDVDELISAELQVVSENVDTSEPIQAKELIEGFAEGPRTYQNVLSLLQRNSKVDKTTSEPVQVIESSRLARAEAEVRLLEDILAGGGEDREALEYRSKYVAGSGNYRESNSRLAELKQILAAVDDKNERYNPKEELLRAGRIDTTPEGLAEIDGLLETIYNQNAFKSVEESAESVDVDELRGRISKLESVVGDWHGSTGGPESLHQELEGICTRLLLLDEAQLVTISQRIKTINEQLRRLQEESSTSLPADIALTSAEAQRIEALYETYIRWKDYGPLLGRLSQRLENLKRNHIKVTLAQRQLEYIEQRLDCYETKIEHLETVQERIDVALVKIANKPIK